MLRFACRFVLALSQCLRPEERALPALAVERALERRLVVREDGQAAQAGRACPSGRPCRLRRRRRRRRVSTSRASAPVVEHEFARGRASSRPPGRTCAPCPSGVRTTSSPCARRASSAKQQARRRRADATGCGTAARGGTVREAVVLEGRHRVVRRARRRRLGERTARASTTASAPANGCARRRRA